MSFTDIIAVLSLLVSFGSVMFSLGFIIGKNVKK